MAKKSSHSSFVDQMDSFTERDQGIRFGKNKSESALDKYTSVADLSTYSDSFKSRTLREQPAEDLSSAGSPESGTTFRRVPNSSFRNNPTGTPIRDDLGYVDHEYSDAQSGVSDVPDIGSRSPFNGSQKPWMDAPSSLSVKPEYRVTESQFSYDDSFVSPSEGGGKLASYKDPFKTYTEAGGGATFYHDYDSKGDVRTKKVALAKFKDRSDKQGFKSKAAEVFDKTGRAVEMVQPEENEAAASNIDDKAILATVIAKGLLDDQIDRYGKIQKEIKRDVKQTKKEIKQISAPPEDSPFLSSQAVFQDDTASFTDRYMGMFREQGKDYKGNDYFDLISAENSNSIDPRNVAAIRKSIEMKRRKDKNSSSSMTSGDSKFTEETSFEKVDSINGSSRVEYEVGNTKAEVSTVNSKFSKTTISGGENKGKKSVDSYFDDSNGNKKDPKKVKEEKLERKKSEEKATKKAKEKAKKKAAATAAVSNMLRMKKEMQNSMGNMSGEVSGDLLKDGSAGMLRATVDMFKAFLMNKVRALIVSFISTLGSVLLQVVMLLLPIIIIVVIFGSVLTGNLGVFTDSVSGMPGGDGILYSSLSEEEIDEIIDDLYLSYPGEFGYTQEMLLRYALSKVGCEYNQNYHSSLTQDIFDCSSLAYRSYREVGIDVSNKSIYTASEECRFAYDNGHIIFDEPIPGDLIFYGNSNNGRFMGVYHVAIYVGNGKMVEARGKAYGVVYSDARTNNVVGYARYAA